MRRILMDKSLLGYEVEFIPFERRHNDRRTIKVEGLPSGVKNDRRKSPGRRTEDLSALDQIKAVR
jgi:hypothetical protein